MTKIKLIVTSPNLIISSATNSQFHGAINVLLLITRAVNEYIYGYSNIRRYWPIRLYLGEDEYSFKQIICPLTLSKYACC